MLELQAFLPIESFMSKNILGKYKYNQIKFKVCDFVKSENKKLDMYRTVEEILTHWKHQGSNYDKIMYLTITQKMSAL